MNYSIILPVFNGGSYLKLCVDSILQQSFQSFNLIILDNNSTDGTTDWLKTINNEKIITYFSTETLDIGSNWNRILSVPQNDFITIIGHDDVLDKNYLSIIDSLIKEHPSASLYQTHFRYIDSKGQIIRKCRPMQPVLQPSEVVHNFLSNTMDIMGTGFMMRSKDFKALGGIPDYPNLLFADMELWIELSRKNYLAVSPEEAFSYRTHPAATTSNSTDAKVLNAFTRFVDYLEKLKKEDPLINETIKKDAIILLQQYCQGITHKVLRTPKEKRQTPSVSVIIDQFREFGIRLTGDNNFEPLDSKKVRLGKRIDENNILHSLFLLFKRVYSKPVY